MRKKFFKYPTQPIEVWPEKSISELTDEMLLTGFQGKSLSRTIDIWARMLKKKEMIIFLGLSGAMIPAGMRKIISYFIKRRMIDILVATGANLYHDCFEALGKKHYVGSHVTDDIKLRKQRIDRIYDIFADELKFYKTDLWIEKEFCKLLKDSYPHSSREITHLLGKLLSSTGRNKDSVLTSAYKNNVPIFCPALCDSSLGFSIMFANRRRGRNILIDEVKGVNEISRIAEKSKQTGVIYIGGGVPKNYIQQTAVIAGYQTRRDKSHNFVIQITTDSPQFGGLSGCSFEEAQSWEK